jgi:hypothetical protein
MLDVTQVKTLIAVGKSAHFLDKFGLFVFYYVKPICKPLHQINILAVSSKVDFHIDLETHCKDIKKEEEKIDPFNR